MPKPLTHVSIANLKARSERYEVSDPGCSGLRVVVFPSGKRSFILRYRYRGLQRKLTLGPSMTARDVAEPDAPPEIGTPLSLAAARQLATTKLREAKGGKTDPAAEKQKQRQQEAAAESDTLQAISDLYLKRVGPGLRTVGQRRSDLELICAKLGRLRVGEIKRSMFTNALDFIADNNGPVRAHRCQSALKTLLNWYSERGDYVSPLLARGGGQRASKPRERFLDDDELRSVWRAAEADTGPFGAFVRFTLLTATRRSEGAGLRRDELSPDGETWVIPGARYKTGKDTLIPLSKAAQAIITAQPARGAFVFSADGSKPLMGFNHRKKAFDMVSGVQNYTLHDLRRSSRTLLSRAGVPADHAEMCLGHALGGVRGTYDRHAYEQEKRHGFESLANLIQHIVDPSDNIVPMKPMKKARRK